MTTLKIPKSLHKGNSKLIELKDNKTSMGYIYIDYSNNGSVQIHQKFQEKDEWECIMNTKRVKVGFPGDNDNTRVKVEL